MLKIKKYAALLMAALLLFPLYAQAESELIPEDQVVSDRINYKSEDASYGDIQREVVANGFTFISQSAVYYYKGEPVIYLETLVKTGDEVEKGDPIYRIKNVTDASIVVEKELHLERLKENYASDRQFLQQDLSKLHSELSGKEGLDAQKLSLQIQRKNVEIEKLDYERNRDIRKAEQELEELKEAISNEYIRAEASGVISELHYFEDGGSVTVGVPLYKITGEAQAMIQVSGNNFMYGMDVLLDGSFQGKDVRLKGKVVCSQNVLRRAGFENSIIMLETTDSSKAIINNMISMANRISIIVASKTITLSGNSVNLKHVLLIPNDARVTDNQEIYVNVLDDNNVLHKRRIKVAVSDKFYTWVLQGLKEGDRVVID